MLREVSVVEDAYETRRKREQVSDAILCQGSGDVFAIMDGSCLICIAGILLSVQAAFVRIKVCEAGQPRNEQHR